MQIMSNERKRQSIKFNLSTNLLYSLGTHFDEAAVGSLINVTIQDGKTAFLNCRINLLQDKTVNIRQPLSLV